MIYYFETNIIAILTGLILLRQSSRLASKGETSQIIMNYMLITLIVFSASDIVAYCSRGSLLAGVHIGNIVYFIAMATGSYLWFLFIIVRTEFIHNMSKILRFAGVPFGVLCIAILLNPLTSFFFSIDDAILYHREFGVYVTWIIEWAYLIAALIINSIAITREMREFKKSELKGYLIFALPMAVAAICQMLFYGTTVTQIGFMFAMIMIYVNNQHFQVQRDGLTGLSNKNSFLNYRDSFVARAKPSALTLFMIDANKFKQINDTYGHLKGDQALKDIAEILKDSTAGFHKDRLLVYRYAGDEFVIIGSNMTDADIESLINAIDENVSSKNKLNKSNGEKYILSLSVGHSTKICEGMSDFDELTAQADREMYKVKQALKQTS